MTVTLHLDDAAAEALAAGAARRDQCGKAAAARDLGGQSVVLGSDVCLPASPPCKISTILETGYVCDRFTDPEGPCG